MGWRKYSVKPMPWRSRAARASAQNIHRHFANQKYVQRNEDVIESESIQHHQRKDLTGCSCGPNNYIDRPGPRDNRFLLTSQHHTCYPGIPWWEWKWSWALCLRQVLRHWRGIRTEEIHSSTPNCTNHCIEEGDGKQENKVFETVQKNSKMPHASP